MNYILNYKTWKKLFEQAESEKSTYGKYNFGGTFRANYIMPSKDIKDLEGKTYNDYLKQMVDDLNKEISENGKKLTEIKITIRSSASATPATNGYSLDKPPAHDFGGLLPKTGWVKTNTKGYVTVPNGNEFLAKNRGIEMKKVLVADLAAAGVPVPDANIQLLPREDGKWVSDSTDPNEQYVKVEIIGALEKSPEPPVIPNYKYSIQYNWYKIGDDDLPYILISYSKFGPGKGKYPDLAYFDNISTTDAAEKANYTKFVNALNTAGDEIKIAGYLDNIKEVGNAKFYAFGTFNKYDAVSNSGNVFYYNNESDWLADARAISMMDPDNIPSSGVKKITGPASSQFEIVSDIFASSGTWTPGKSGKIVFEHGAGASIPKNHTFYLLKPKDGEAQTDKLGRQHYGTISIQNVYQKDFKPKVTKTASTPSLKK